MENGHMFPESEDARNIVLIEIEKLKELERLAEIGEALEWAEKIRHGRYDLFEIEELLDSYRNKEDDYFYQDWLESQNPTE